jgi:multidrug resistance protein MdtO
MTAIELVRDELMVSPPRRARMLRMTAIVALIVVISMTKRVPDAAISAYMIFFIAQRDVAMTVGVGLGGVLGVTLAIALALLCFLLSIGEPALRVPLMVAFAFGGMYLMRATPAGALGLLLGFVPFYALTFADWVPSPEALVRALLWLWVVIAYPIGLLVLADLAFGSRPAEVYRSGIAERLAAVAAVLGAGPDREAQARLDRYVRLGASELVPYVERSGPDRAAPIRATLLRQTELLGLLVRDLPDEVRRDPAARPALQRASGACAGARDALLGRDGATHAHFELLAAERRGLVAMPPAARAVVVPLVNCVQTVVLSVHELARGPVAEASPLIHLPKPRPPADATEGVRFALKVTLAATIAYLLYTGLDWYGIHTATITCFFVAGASVGATIHKLTLRLVGAIIGSALGMLSIIFVLPAFESIGGLTVLIAAATLLSAWIATGSGRISYAGFQIALAFYLSVLQGFGPTTKLSVGRDRIIGVLVGNVLMSVVFTSLWPVRVEPAQRRALARAVDALAAMLRTASGDRDALDRAEAEFYDQISRARQYAVPVWFERARSERGSILTVVQGLFIPVHAIVRTPPPATASPAARAALASADAGVSGWLHACAAAIASSAPAPPPPSPDPATAALGSIAKDDNEPAEARAHVRQQLEWLELLHVQGVELAGRGPT